MSSVLDAVYHTVRNYPGGAEALATRMGCSANVLRNKVSPNKDTHHLRLDEAVAMMALTGDAQVLYAMADELGYFVSPAIGLEEFSNTDLLVEFNRLYQGIGQFAAHTNTSVADGKIDDKERRALFRDVLTSTGQMHAIFRQLMAVYGRDVK